MGKTITYILLALFLSMCAFNLEGTTNIMTEIHTIMATLK